MTVFDPRIDLIIDIDGLFERMIEHNPLLVLPLAWDSRMRDLSSGREALVNQLNAEGHNIEHKYQAGCEDGSRTD